MDTTMCPRSSDPFYIVTYYMKWITTSWTYSMDGPPSLFSWWTWMIFGRTRIKTPL